MVSGPNRTQALFDKLQRLSHLPSSPRPETVHQLRSNIRRVETLMAATWPTPTGGKQKLIKQLDRIRRRAGKVRDLDVQIAALRTLRLDSITRDKARVTLFLEKSRVKRERKLLKASREELKHGLEKRLKRTAGRLLDASSNRHAKNPQSRERDSLPTALEKFAGLVQQRPALNETNLHDFRMACKRIRYLAEMAGNGRGATAVVTQLKRIQDSIGDWHDWLTLSNTAETLLSGSGQSPLVSALRASTRSKHLEALRTTADAQRVLLEMYQYKRISKQVRSPKPEIVMSKMASA